MGAQYSICAVSITRTIEVYKLDYSDPSYELLTTNFWSSVEPALLIANSCIPLLRPPLQSMLSRFWTKTRYATQYAFGSNKETSKLKTVTGKPMSRQGLSRYAGAMGNAGGTMRTSTNVRSVTVREEDDEIEMVPSHPYLMGTGGVPVRSGSEGRTNSSDLEVGGIRVQKDWYVTEEKFVDSNV